MVNLSNVGVVTEINLDTSQITIQLTKDWMSKYSVNPHGLVRICPVESFITERSEDEL